jgi:hypothetical protein
MNRPSPNPAHPLFRAAQQAPSLAFAIKSASVNIAVF